MQHELKTLDPFWSQVRDGIKRFEVRENDRGFQKGDTLILRLQVPGEPMTGQPALQADVDYILSGWGLKNGYVAMSLRNVKEIER